MAATQHAQQIKQDSQTYLTTALLQLLETKDLSDITVAQVVRRAGVSRMAFYRNFDTLDDILIAYFRPLIAARFNDVVNQAPQNEKLSALGEFFGALTDTLNLAVKRGFEHVIQQIFDENMMHFYETTVDWQTVSTTQKKYWIKFMTAGVYAIWREWLLSGQSESLESIHEILAKFQTATFAALSV